MAAQIPPGGQIFLTSRFEPPPTFAAALLHQNLTLIQWENFQLTPEEIREISLEFHASAVSRPQSEMIYAKTIGWAAAVVLILTQSCEDLPNEVKPDKMAVPRLY